MQDKRIDKLLTEISEGSNEAFGKLYDETKRGVFSFVYSYMRNREDAEDVMQTVYLKIKLNIDSYRHGSNARAWILQIAKNQALNEPKRRRPSEELDESAAVSEDPQSTEISELMQKVLSEDEREIVILHVLWGYRHREIADRLACPVGTVLSKYNRSVKKLKDSLKEAGV